MIFTQQKEKKSSFQLVFINKIYVIVLITGNKPITPKLLNIKDSVVAKNINIIFAFKSNLSL